jgi:hypothetical protein
LLENQSQKIALLLCKEEARIASLSRKVEKHERMVANDRIAQLATKVPSI